MFHHLLIYVCCTQTHRSKPNVKNNPRMLFLLLYSFPSHYPASFHGKASIKSVSKLFGDQLHPQGLNATILGLSKPKRMLIHFKLLLLVFFFFFKLKRKTIADCLISACYCKLLPISSTELFF